jgi:TonB-linked SusC/RagA family outer membrane protein
MKKCIGNWLLVIAFSLAGQRGITQAKKDSVRQDTIAVAPWTKTAGRVPLIYNSLPADLTASSTQTVYGNDLTHMPVSSVLNSLSGRLAGLSTTQSSGAPGSDGVSVLLRGQAPLILIDGVVRTLVGFDPGEIASVTVLKDALATATLGVRGMNGAILITTKNGSEGPPAISFTARTSIQSSINVPKILDAYHYATLYNEALANDGQAPAYSPAYLQGYLNKTNPYLYPDVNWLNQLTNKYAGLNEYTLNSSGGNQNAHYFVSLEYMDQNGNFKTNGMNQYNTNDEMSRYNARSNVTFNITKRLSAGVNIFGSIENLNVPGSLTFPTIIATPQNAYPIYNQDGSYGGTQQYTNNLEASSISSGYKNDYYRTVSADFYLKREMDDVLPGLWVKAVGTYYSYVDEEINRTKTFAVFQNAPTASGGAAYSKIGQNGVQANSDAVQDQSTANYLEFSAGYNRTFNRVNGIDVLLLANRDNSADAIQLPYTIVGASGRAAYNYKEKYVAELSFGYNGSDWNPPDGNYKMGFFPAAGLAWNINKESFMSRLNWVNRLKLFTSYGKTGNDVPGYFQYEQGYEAGPGVYFGTSAGTVTTQTQMPLADPTRAVETTDKWNTGLQGSLLRDRLDFSIEYFIDSYHGMLETTGQNTSILGTAYPQQNRGINRYYGSDIRLNWQQRLHRFSYSIGVNAGVLNSKVIYMDEAYKPYPWMRQTGNRVGRPFGYIADGLFQSQAEITGAPTVMGYTPQPGDIRYKDLNHDGVINQDDQAPIGSGKPVISYGLTLALSYAGLDFSAVFQGEQSNSIYLSTDYWAFQNNGSGVFGQAFAYNLDRWTPANPNAAYPRLGLGANINNNVNSSYWYHSANYLRAKNIELGYSLPASLVKKVRLKTFRLFVSASNLFTLSALKEGIDPEIVNGQYPMQKIFSAGATIKF